MSHDTVKIRGHIEMPLEGVSYSEFIDTELTADEWAALDEASREEFAERLLKGWVENLVQSGWSES